MSEEHEEKSSWDELVGELGVDVTDNALERRQPAPRDIPSRRRTETTSKEQTQAASSDWETLAATLGIEAPPLAERPPATQPVSRREEKPTLVQAPIEGQPSEEDSQSGVQDESERVDSSEFIEQLDDEAESSQPRITGEAARSAFDALFAVDAASWGSAFVSPRTNVESSFLFTEGEEAVFAEDIPEEAVEEGDEEDEPKRGRRRRRGGRGRGRGRSGSKSAAQDAPEKNQDGEDIEESLGEQAGEAESDEDREKGRRRRRSRGRSRQQDDLEITSEEEDSRLKKHIAAHVGDEEDDDAFSGDEEDGSSSAGVRSSHRNLPTWDEAIGVIVDTNLAQRSKSPAKSSSSRGRPRGGRRHKKS